MTIQDMQLITYGPSFCSFCPEKDKQNNVVIYTHIFVTPWQFQNKENFIIMTNITSCT